MPNTCTTRILPILPDDMTFAPPLDLPVRAGAGLEAHTE